MSEKSEKPDIQNGQHEEETPGRRSNIARIFSLIAIPVVLFLTAVIGVSMYLNSQKAEAARVMKVENDRIAAEKLAKERALKAEQERQEVIEEIRKEAWGRAVAARDEAMIKPEIISSAITRFNEIRDSLKGTDYEKKADIEIASLEAARKKAVEQTIAGLVKKASELASKKDFEAAADVFRNYSGPLARETGEERLKIAETYLASSRDMIEKGRKFRQTKNEFLKNISSLILKNKISNALEAYDEFTSKYAAEKIDGLATVKGILDTVQHNDKFLLESCRNNVGRKIVAKVGGPYESVEISRIKDDSIYVKKLLGTATMETKIGVGSLSPKEKIKRSDRMDNASRAVFTAMIEVELGNYENAEKALEPGGLLSESLAEAIRGMKREMEDKKSAETTKMNVKEDSTAKGFVIASQHITIKADANAKNTSKGKLREANTIQDISLNVSLSNTAPADFTNNKIEIYLLGESTAENHICQVLAVEKKDLSLKKNESLDIEIKANSEFNKLSFCKYGAEYCGYLIVIKDKTGKIFTVKTNRPAFQKFADKIVKMSESSEFDERTGEERKGVPPPPVKR
ncbi:MAG: hypothetical protein WCS96_01970 [Victivallales bacterium]